MVNPKAETLQDNFNDNSLDTNKWSNFGGANVVETNQELEITTTLTPVTYGIDSVNLYDLTSSYVYCKLEIVDPTIASVDTIIAIYLDASNYIRWTVEASDIYAQYVVGGGGVVTVNSTAYNSTNHKWLRMRENGGTTYWDISTDGMSWTNFTSVANQFTLTGIFVEISSGAFAIALSTTVAKFDNVNILDNWLMRFMT